VGHINNKVKSFKCGNIFCGHVHSSPISMVYGCVYVCWPQSLDGSCQQYLADWMQLKPMCFLQLQFRLLIDICFYANFSTHFQIKALALLFNFIPTACSLNPSLLVRHFNYFCNCFLFYLVL
jgi:hypothetical protein